MFIGLGISLALIAEGMMFMYSFQYGGFTGFYREPPIRQFSIGISALPLDDVTEEIDEIDAIVEATIVEQNLKERVDQIDWFLGRGLFLVADSLVEIGNWSIIPNFSVYGVPPDYLSALNSILYNGSMPQKTKEVIVVAPQATIETTNISYLDLVSVYTPVIGLPPPTYEEIIEMGKPDYGTDINVTGVITSEIFTNPPSEVEDRINTLNEYLGDYCILTSYTSFSVITN